ncbi:FecR family protein [Pyxidicoccus xibeiensis]|uniref:FecR family protein n=1 Tax=Pyxidicoccus xibeiensis TaxID=2906759 RepID=UPI0020A7E2E6|nr:FecR family protein [Pyxidicoccus xibeiensis]MCP3138398.1 FecR family protein [Pyxidicoccus xibeiensis]
MLLALALSASPLGCTDDETPPAPVAPSRPTPQPRAHLRGLKGDVQIKRATADDWSAAHEGLPLFENDKVRTEANALADLVFANDGGTVHLGADSLIGVAETRPRPGQQRTDLTVLRGRIDAELEQPSTQSLSVTTPAATIQAGREIVFQ